MNWKVAAIVIFIAGIGMLVYGLHALHPALVFITAGAGITALGLAGISEEF